MKGIQTTKALGAAIRQARLDAGMSQATLAAKAGVSRPWLSQLETGKRTTELGLVLTVLGALGLAIDITAAPPTSPSEVDLDHLLTGDS